MMARYRAASARTDMIQSWNNIRLEILQSADDSNIEDLLMTTNLALPTFFDIERLHPYFGMTSMYGKVRIDVTYRTSLSNVRSAVHAGRITSGIIAHLKKQVSSLKQDVAIWTATPVGSVALSGGAVDFHFYVFLRKLQGPLCDSVSMHDTPQELTKRWKTIFTSASIDYLDTTKRFDQATASGGSSQPLPPRPVDTTAGLPETVCIGVYGNMRKGMHMHQQYLATSTLLATARAPGVLFPVGDFERSIVPGAMFDLSSQTSVVVEVYSVSRALLKALDAVEGWTGSAQTSSYTRKFVTATDDNGKKYGCYMYEYPRTQYKAIEHGDWAKHRAAQLRSTP